MMYINNSVMCFSGAVVSFDAVSSARTEGLSVSLVLNLTSIPEGGFQDNSLTVTLTTIDQGKTSE